MSSSFRIGLALAAASLASLAQAATQYTYLDIGATIEAVQINGRGDVVARLTNGRTAVYVFSKSQWNQIGPQPNDAGQSLNDRDEVAGERNYGGKGRPHAVIFKPSGKIADLLRSRESYATVIRDDGTIYGSAQPFGGDPTFPFIWQAGNVVELAPLAGSAWTVPIGSTKSGEIAANGVSDPREKTCPSQAAVYHDSSWHGLGSLGGTCVMAAGMNDLGDVVGWSSFAGDDSGTGFLWHDGAMTAIPCAGGSTCNATDINTLGQIVGSEGQGGDSWAYIYAEGVMTHLDDVVVGKPAGYHFFEAIALNEAGQILVTGTTGSNVDTFVLTPAQ